MKKRVLSMFMALALCLTLLPAPVRAAEDTPESGAIVQVPLTPVALRTVKQMRRRAARMKTPGTMRTRRYPLCRR